MSVYKLIDEFSIPEVASLGQKKTIYQHYIYTGL